MHLETLPNLIHTHCYAALDADWLNKSAFEGHQSVTEVEICEDRFTAYETAEAAQWEADEMAERVAFRSTYETDIQYLEESIYVAGPLGY